MNHTDSQFRVKVGLAEMLKGGVIMDVTTADQAKIAEDAGAAAVMALERVPADIRVQGGVARMSSIEKIQEIQKTVSIPVMAKVRIGHIAEAKILEALEVDFIDESEVLTPADEENHISKHGFAVQRGIRTLTILEEDELMSYAKELQAPFELVRWVAEKGHLPVPNFAAGGVATPADAALCMMLGAESVFVGSGVFKSDDPELRGRAIVQAVTHWQDPAKLVEISRDLGEAMHGLEAGKLTPEEMLSRRGW
jgi:pyridoxal 5'-phosphate synthase pdxS subunit